MASDKEYIEYVCDQIKGIGILRYKKMFGEYMIYVNDKPIILVCDNTVYVKMLDCIEALMRNADRGCPYKGAKEHFVLDIDDRALCYEVLTRLEEVTPLPIPKKKKVKVE
ncbi:MAG: TfoX/Sxy family protein [Coprobacillus sp.]